MSLSQHWQPEGSLAARSHSHSNWSITSLCYPNCDHSLSDLSEIKRALKILRKYDVQRIPDSVGLALMLAVNEHPTTVCAIACGYNLPAVANFAAKASLKWPLFSDASHSDEDLDLMTASQYNKFLRYHKNVATIASTTASSFKWMGQDDPIPTAFRLCKCPSTQIVSPQSWASPVADWVIQWRKDMADALTITPDFNTVSRRGVATMRATTTAISSGCPSCRTELEKLPVFADFIASKVDAVTAQVSLLRHSVHLIKSTTNDLPISVGSSSILRVRVFFPQDLYS